MAVGDICTLRVVGKFQDQNIVNTLHYRITSQAATEHDVLESLCLGWETALKSSWVGRHITTYTLVGLKAFRKTGPAKIPGFRTIGQAGSVAGTEVPAAVCRTLTLYTDSTKFRRRGRIMLSGSASAMFNTTDGGVTSTELTALNTLASLLEATVSNGGDDFLICIPPAGADPYEDIEEIVARHTPSMVRSRRIRQFLIG